MADNRSKKDQKPDKNRKPNKKNEPAELKEDQLKGVSGGLKSDSAFVKHASWIE